MLLYMAKKRAEAAPGVGLATDMFFVTPKAPANVINPQVLSEIDRIFREAVAEFTTVTTKVNEKMKEYVGNVLKQASSQPQTAQDQPKPLST